MSTRVTLPRWQFADANGRPLAAAEIYTYETGTTTPKATYSDAGLSVANANPIEADSAGRFGDIFLDAGDYRFVLKDADGATIWTADDISGASDALLLTGGELTGFLTLHADPTFAMHAVTKQYVDAPVLFDTTLAAPAAAVTLQSLLSSAYDTYLIDVLNIAPATDAQDLRLQWSSDNGSNWVNTNVAYVRNDATVASATFVGTSSNTASGAIIAPSMGNGGGETGNFRIILQRITTGVRASVRWEGDFLSSSPANTRVVGAAFPGGDFNAVRLIYASGNIASGARVRMTASRRS